MRYSRSGRRSRCVPGTRRKPDHRVLYGGRPDPHPSPSPRPVPPVNLRFMLIRQDRGNSCQSAKSLSFSESYGSAQTPGPYPVFMSEAGECKLVTTAGLPRPRRRISELPKDLPVPIPHGRNRWLMIHDTGRYRFRRPRSLAATQPEQAAGQLCLAPRHHGSTTSCAH